MAMSALNRKLLRDLYEMKAQALAIASDPGREEQERNGEDDTGAPE